MWRSYASIWDTCLRLDILTLAFINRRSSDKKYDISESVMKDCLTTSSLGWKLMMSLGQDEAIYTSTHSYSEHFPPEHCYGGTVGAKVREFESTALTKNLNVIKSHLKSNAEDIFTLMEQFENYTDV